jgi:branched-chain amino acid transport system permease protein
VPPLDYVVEQVLIGISTGAIYAIIAIGYNLVFGVLNVLNLAHGAIMMVGSFGVLLLYYLGLRDFWLASAFGVALALFTGLLVERIAVRPLKGNWWNTKVATLGCAMFLENFVTRLTEGRPMPFPRPFAASYYQIAGTLEISNVQIFLILCSLGIMAGMVWFLRGTSPGKAIRVVAQSPDLAQCLGINVQQVMVLGFAVSALLAGVAGILNAVTFGSTYPFVGQLLGLKGLVILIVAGIGNMRGCLVVALMLGVLESFAVVAGGSAMRELVAYTGMVVILLVRPLGLFGEEGRTGKEI